MRNKKQILFMLALIASVVTHAQKYTATRFYLIRGEGADSIFHSCKYPFRLLEKEKLITYKPGDHDILIDLDSVTIRASNQYQKAIGYRVSGIGKHATVFIEKYKQGWGMEYADVKITIRTDEYAIVYYLTKD